MASTDRSFSDVLKNIFENIEDVLRSELKLAKAEVREGVARSTRGAGWLAAGLVSALFALGFLLVTAFFALLFVVPNWAAASIIAVALGLISTITFQIGGSKRKTTRDESQSFAAATPQEEILAWAKQHSK
jgi:hypothetical protein